MNHIIGRLLSGEASSDDILNLSDWLHEDDSNRIEFQQLKSYWDAEVSYLHSIDPALSMDKIMGKMQGKQKGYRLWPLYLAAIASVALVLIILNLSGLFGNPNVLQEAESFYTYLTDNNTSDITLSDGSKVVLNKYSSLTYSDKYGQGKREVKLQGEAYFEVAKDADNPFKLDLGNATIHVLGTTFSAKADPEFNQITTTLLEGSIRFESPEQQIMLTPNQQLDYKLSDSSIQVKTVDAEEEVLWKDGIINYKSISFISLITNLEITHGVEIVINNERLKNPDIMITGKFTNEQSLEEIFNVINRSMPIQWRKKDTIYYIQ